LEDFFRFSGSARTIPEDPAYDYTRRFAKAMAEKNWMVITGAGPGIMAAGHGGQILLSSATASLLEDELPESWSLLDLGEHQLKGLGRAALREKIVEIHARRFLVIGDASKAVPRLGQGPLPVEIVTFESEVHVRWLNSLGCRAELWRAADSSPVVTDNGNYLVRCWFEGGIPDAYTLARTLADRPGIIEHGLFLDMADEVALASSDGLQIMERK